MRLINSKTGDPVIEGRKTQIVTGKNKDQIVKVNEIILPSAEKPDGMVIVDRDKSGWRQYYPFVIGAEWEKGEPVPAEQPQPVKIEAAEVQAETFEAETSEATAKPPELPKYAERPLNADLSIPPASVVGG